MRGPENQIFPTSVPIGIATSLIFGYIWIYYFDQPSPDLIDQYVQAVILVCFSAIIELSFEPFFVIGQIFMWVDFRAIVDFSALLIRAILLTLGTIHILRKHFYSPKLDLTKARTFVSAVRCK